MEEQYKQHGMFSWCELMTSDVEAAKSFYTRLFGWETKDMSMQGMNYTVITAGNKEIGGIMSPPKEAQGMPPRWGTYVTVKNVDETAKTAEQLGATICMQPQDIPDVGRFCVILDPQGAAICAITYDPAHLKDGCNT